MLRRILIIAQAAFLLGGFNLASRADEAGPVQIPPPRPLLEIPFISKSPAPNANINDPAWNSAATIHNLGLALGSPAGQTLRATSIKAMWDLDFLYIRCQVDNDLIPYAAAHGPNGDLTGDDAVVLQIDTQGTAQHWMQLKVSADNDIRDESFSLAGIVKSDSHFCLDPELIKHGLRRTVESNIEGLMTATRLTRGGWLVDIAIPATPLLTYTGKTQFASSMTFRANFLRYQYIDGASPGDPPQRLVMDWASVVSDKAEVSPEAMGFLQLVGGTSP